MGYSLPPGDTSIRQMLLLHAPGNIIVVDNDPSVANHFQEIFGTPVQESAGEDPIPQWVRTLAISANDEIDR